MNRRFVTCISAAALVVATTSSALALKNEQFQGKPEAFTPGKLNTGVWHDEDGQHIRFSTAGKKDRVYSGKVCAEKILKADGFQLEAGDSLAIEEGGVCLTFSFKTDGAVDGIDFRAEGPGITFDLQIDGRPIPQNDIHIGSKSVNPKANPFVLNRM